MQVQIQIFCLSLLPISIFSQSEKSKFPIHFINQAPTLDGYTDDWAMPRTATWQIQKQQPRYRNTAHARLGFDEENLYGAFEIEDKNLVEIETEPGNPRLYLNDGLEIYLDTRADSRRTMDANDFQIIIDLRGRVAVLRGGDKFQTLVKKSRVPKDTVTQIFSIQTACRQRGSVNDTTDLDTGFSIEFGIPWATLGISPHEGLQLHLDLCLNDNDTLTDFRSIPEGVEVPQFSYQSITGGSDFGFPDRWLAASLVGKASGWHRVERAAGRQTSGLLFFLGFVLLPIFLAMAWRNFQLSRAVRARSNLQKNMLHLLAPPPTTAAEPLPQFFEKKDSPNWQLVLAARTIVREKLADDISPSLLASRLFVSLRQLQRIFREELDMTPNQFILSMKMEQALVLLRAGGMNVSEAAFMVGFSDPAYFSKVFKKFHGLPPSEVLD